MVEIRAGEGGDDAKNWAGELSSAYIRFATKQGLTVEILDASSKGHMVLQVSGPSAYELFKHESGKHEVQRVPPNERNGRMHTSIAVVGILPLFSFNHKALAASDIRVETKRGSGPGGQHRNKTDSMVVMTHVPTGLKASVDGRDQSRNKKKALELLTARVNQHNLQLVQSKHNTNRKNQIGEAGRGGTTRTYNFKHGYVYDKVLNKKVNQIDKIMKGEFLLLQR